MMRSDLLVSLSRCGCLPSPARSPTPVAVAPPPEPPRDPKTDPHDTRPETIGRLHPKTRMRSVWLGLRASLTGAWRTATPDDMHPRAAPPR